MSRAPPQPPGGGADATKVALAALLSELRQPALAAEARQAAAAVGPGAAAGDASLERVMATMSRLAADAEANAYAPGASAAGTLEGIGDDVLASMAAEFESLGAKVDFGAAVDNVMRQLLHADVMLAPMRRICELFPAWLAENAPRLTAAQYQQ